MGVIGGTGGLDKAVCIYSTKILQGKQKIELVQEKQNSECNKQYLSSVKCCWPPKSKDFDLREEFSSLLSSLLLVTKPHEPIITILALTIHT